MMGAKSGPLSRRRRSLLLSGTTRGDQDNSGQSNANPELSIPGRNVDSLREFSAGAEQGNSLAASAASTLANGFSALRHDWQPSP